MDLTRSEFLRLLAGTGISAVSLSALGACDGSDAKNPDASPGNPDAPKVDAAIDAPIDAPPAGNCTQNGTTVVIMFNHGHVLAIPKEDVVAGVQKTYTMTGGTHTHPITITAAMFTMLQNNMPVQTDVDPSGHPHPTTIRCA